MFPLFGYCMVKIIYDSPSKPVRHHHEAIGSGTDMERLGIAIVSQIASLELHGQSAELPWTRVDVVL